jgi:hypothetical protein
LASLNSHVPLSPPEIRVQHYEADAHEKDGAASCDRLYINHLIPIMDGPNRSRANSVGPDGDRQDDLASKEPPDMLPVSLSLRLARAEPRCCALQLQIYRAMEESQSEDASLPTQRFLPNDKLCQIINPTTVFDELVKCLPHTKDQIQKYAEAICNITLSYEGGRWRRKSCRMVFVILVLAEKTKHIISFLEEHVSDLDLPLVPKKERGIVMGMQRSKSASIGTSYELLECFNDKGWSPLSMEQFDRYQWFMLSPFFSEGRCGQINHYPLHDQQVLPFVSHNAADEEATEYQGGYGRVMMVTMHRAHHRLSQKNSRNCNFAVKQLWQNDRKSFEKEREILKRFSGSNSHAHIVSLLATYSHRGKYHYIFDRAQGDLGRFWDSHRISPRLAHGDVLWVAGQCLGIAEGLDRIHRHKTIKKRIHSISKIGNNASFMASDRTFTSENETLDRYDVKYGLHGDINPSNILWFSEEPEGSDAIPGIMRGTFKIADFGSAEMNPFWNKSGVKDVANTITYRPPECDLADSTIRQSFDTWCLGCVFLEFAAWTLGGAKLVMSFSRKRLSHDPACGNVLIDTYFELVYRNDEHVMEPKIKDSVLKVFFFISKYYVLIAD